MIDEGMKETGDIIIDEEINEREEDIIIGEGMNQTGDIIIGEVINEREEDIIFFVKHLME